VKCYIKKIKINKNRLLIISQLYEIDQLETLNKISQSEDIIVFMGDMFALIKSEQEAINFIKHLEIFNKNKQTYYILGDRDLLYKSKVSTTNVFIYNWLDCQLLGLKVLYSNSSNFLFLHGGLLPNYQQLEQIDYEAAFIKNWHKTYNGHLGYVVSAHHTEKQTTKYSYSLGLNDNSNRLIVQEINSFGLVQTLLL
jgi:UDP-2,3-diacylglucosamine pyrophosphatase LpxH